MEGRVLRKWLSTLALVLFLPTLALAQVQPVKPVGSTLAALFPNAFASADNVAAQTATFMHGGMMVWDGSNWDRWTGAVSQSGTWNITNISGTVSLPTGAATETTLATLLTTSAFQARINTLGQKTMANSTPVVIASDQTAIPASQSGTWNINNISGTVSLPTGAATAALQDGIIRDGTGDTTQANVTSGRLNVDPGTVTVTDGSGALNVIVDSGTTTVTQATASNLNAQVVGPAADGAAVSGNPVRIAGKDGSGNTQDIITDSAGELQVDVLTLPNVTIGTLPNEGQQTMANSISVAIASDQSTLTTALSQTGANNDVDVLTLPSVTIGTFPDNEPFNVAQFGGSAVVTGTGASGSGIPRVTIANDSSLAANQSVNVNQIGGTAVTVGADNSSNSTAKLPALVARANTSDPSWTDGNQVPLSVIASSGRLRVDSSGGGAADGTTFTENSTTFSAAGGVYNEALSGISSGKEYAARITGSRALHTNLRNDYGIEIGTRNNPMLVALAPQMAVQQSPLALHTSRIVAGPFNQPVGLNGDRLKVESTLPWDPCMYSKKQDVPVSQTASTRVIVGQPFQSIYVCSIRLVAAAAEIVSLWEGTGTTCGTTTVAHAGSTTAANGESLAANGGYQSGNGGASVVTLNPGTDFCIAQNTSSRVSGTVSYVLAPY